MKCPVCKITRMETVEIEPELYTLTCSGCGGHWIQSFRYWQWRNQHGSYLLEKPPDLADSADLREPSVPKLCPECVTILIPHRVGHGLAFRLDRCGNCGGMWFDRSEWEALKARNLHDDVHRIFNAVWQREVLEAEKADTRERRLATILGEADLSEIHRVREWINRNPRRETLLAFLMQEQE